MLIHNYGQLLYARYGKDEIVRDNVLDGMPKAIDALRQVVDPFDITPAQTTKTDRYVKAPPVLPGIGLAAAKPGAGRACPSPHLTAMGHKRLRRLRLRQGKACPQGASLPIGTVEGEDAAQSSYPVGEANQARAVPQCGASDTVIVNGQVQDVAAGPRSDVGVGRVGVLGGVGQRLRDDVVGRHLDRLGQPLGDVHVEFDRIR
jgi:hypothetical protein